MSVMMTSSRPYLIRAMYEWISDNNMTPYILVNANAPGAVLPEQYIENGKIVLNISEQAVSQLQQDNHWIHFSARFSGRPMDISVPVTAVQAIYAKENGQGMVLDREDNGPPTTPPPANKSQKSRRKKPHLELVK